MRSPGGDWIAAFLFADVLLLVALQLCLQVKSPLLNAIVYAILDTKPDDPRSEIDSFKDCYVTAG